MSSKIKSLNNSIESVIWCRNGFRSFQQISTQQLIEWPRGPWKMFAINIFRKRITAIGSNQFTGHGINQNKNWCRLNVIFLPQPRLKKFTIKEKKHYLKNLNLFSLHTCMIWTLFPHFQTRLLLVNGSVWWSLKSSNVWRFWCIRIQRMLRDIFGEIWICSCTKQYYFFLVIWESDKKVHKTVSKSQEKSNKTKTVPVSLFIVPEQKLNQFYINFTAFNATSDSFGWNFSTTL